VRTTDRARLLVLLFAWPAIVQSAGLALTVIPAGPFADDECLSCHTEHDPQRMTAYRDGPHNEVGCSACHGDRHGNLSTSRADVTCVRCHAGAEAASHEKSKHGVLLRIAPPDTSAPLLSGRYRVPGCAYCHRYAGDHGDRMSPARSSEEIAWVCGGCHSSRFAMTQLAAGRRLVAIADLKLREANRILGCQAEGSAELDALMQSALDHARNVRLGAGHQSPDYQWWYGQPALDGDLIRLREQVESRRRSVRQRDGAC